MNAPTASTMVPRMFLVKDFRFCVFLIILGTHCYRRAYPIRVGHGLAYPIRVDHGYAYPIRV